MAKTSRTQRRFASTTSAREEAREETDCTDWCRSPPVLYASSSPSIASTTGANAAAARARWRARAKPRRRRRRPRRRRGGGERLPVRRRRSRPSPRRRRRSRARGPRGARQLPLRDERGGRARASAAFSRRRTNADRVFLRHPSGARERRGQRVRAEHRGIDPRDALRGPRVDGEPLAVQARAQLDPRGDRLRERGGGGRDEERQARRRRSGEGAAPVRDARCVDRRARRGCPRGRHDIPGAPVEEPRARHRARRGAGRPSAADGRPERLRPPSRRAAG